MAVGLVGCHKSKPAAVKNNSTKNAPHKLKELKSITVKNGTTKTKELQEKSPQKINNQLYDSRHNAITKSVAEVSPAVVSVSVTEVVKEQDQYDPFFGFFLAPGRMRKFKSLGTGFIISENGMIVTNQHVIGKNAARIIVTTSKGKSYDAKVIGEDEYADIALLKIKAKRKLPFVHFGDSDKAIVGEWCIAIGDPFGLFEKGEPTVTVGVISAVKRDFRPDPREPRAYLDMLQTDAAINKGNSGGPLVNSLGQVIGMNTFIYTGGASQGNVGLGFAIPSNTIVKIITQLEEKGKVSLGYDPGFQVKPITAATAYKYNLPIIQGVFVYSVNKDGPAYKAGILPGDILLKIGNERIYSYTHFEALLREYKKGDKMKLVILRKGHLYETSMVLRNKVKKGQKAKASQKTE
ncbi:MAG TPA: trypsin-like peptidase domain-containing protein [Balneolales bacterium]|nr:trypsin-like peptidase domain-containing protein [Balneolales bacterium]